MPSEKCEKLTAPGHVRPTIASPSAGGTARACNEYATRKYIIVATRDNERERDIYLPRLMDARLGTNIARCLEATGEINARERLRARTHTYIHTERRPTPFTLPRTQTLHFLAKQRTRASDVSARCTCGIFREICFGAASFDEISADAFFLNAETGNARTAMYSIASVCEYTGN